MRIYYKVQLVIVVALVNIGFLFAQKKSSPVEYVNPYMGNISHLLVPTYPTIHMPNSMLRVYPQRDDFTGDRLHGLPLVVTSHRGKSAFNLSPYNSSIDANGHVLNYVYDNEVITPYAYKVNLVEHNILTEYAVSEQSAIYRFDSFDKQTINLKLRSENGYVMWDGRALTAKQDIGNNTNVYLYAVTNNHPVSVQSFKRNANGYSENIINDPYEAIDLKFADKSSILEVSYGISFISVEQAKANLNRELEGKSIAEVQSIGRKKWNEVLSKIDVHSKSNDDKVVFYTSLYRTFERPVKISEDSKYFSAFDGKVHEDNGIPFYTDDWIWDSYRAHHPLNVLIEPEKETHIIQSFIRMAEQMPNPWLPTFPEINGDSRRMNSNHGVATILDAYVKGIQDFDLKKAYVAAKAGITEKTLAPWSGKPSGELDHFFKKNGYIPALYEGQEEHIPEVDHFERRQPVAVTLGTSYDLWCLAQIAQILGYRDDYENFMRQSFNYRNLFNHETKFFHPKDDKGNFIQPFDYVFSGGQGARGYYGENNAWIYRWDVQHNIPDLIDLMGGNKAFGEALDDMFRQSLGRSKHDFYAQLPDHTGNVGQFSMANEPSLHIPYLYNYVGESWKTQKRIKSLVKQWFRNDLMGVPGDEDGGGMSSFVVFSQLGFYPVTPGTSTYSIGSPFFEKTIVKLPNGRSLKIIAENLSDEAKYIKKATLNGRVLTKPEITHQEILNGGILKFEMTVRPSNFW